MMHEIKVLHAAKSGHFAKGCSLPKEIVKPDPALAAHRVPRIPVAREANPHEA